MIQEKLRNLRKEKGITQEKMAKILSTDPSNYSRKEQGKVKIHDEEWEKMAAALNVPLDEIKEDTKGGVVHNDNSSFNDNSGNYYIQHFNIPNNLIDTLQDCINLLKDQVHELKEDNKKLKEENTKLKSKI